uniref:Unannotated protein n=1 Tax=freshwater metagenome TaxID=449393 RepID=A0A6J5ZTW8_9ZZZZ
MRPKSSVMTLSNLPFSGVTPPTTLVPPPNGTTAIPTFEQILRSERISLCDAG